MANLLLIHSDTTNGSTTFTDSSGNNVALTANGNVQHSTAQAKFGATSIYFDGTGDYIGGTLPSAIGTGDFTIDFWYRRSGAVVQNLIVTGDATTGAFAVYVSSDGKIIFYAGSAIRLTSSTTSLGVWLHCAVVRSSGTTRMYIDGVDIGSSYADLNNYTVAAFTVSFTSGFLYGYIDELRITNTAEWTANFTPPTTPYVTYSVSGTITEDTGAPCARTVRLYDRATGAFIAETTSDASTGAYNFSTVPTTDEVQRIVLDDSDGTVLPDLIKRVIPG
jgi:hypothetical protein